jgi:hypothetical protein
VVRDKVIYEQEFLLDKDDFSFEFKTLVATLVFKEVK